MAALERGTDGREGWIGQLLYQCAACLWLLSYSGGVKEKLVKMELVAVLVQTLKATSKEKVIRMTLAILVNLIETGDMKSLLSVCGGQRILDTMKVAPPCCLPPCASLLLSLSQACQCRLD